PVALGPLWYASVLFSLCAALRPPDLPSFPTRRASDLRRPRFPRQVPVDAPLDGRDHQPQVGSFAGRHAVERGRVLDRRRSPPAADRKSTRLNSSHGSISYAVFCLKKKTQPKPAPSTPG